MNQQRNRRQTAPPLQNKNIARIADLARAGLLRPTENWTVVQRPLRAAMRLILILAAAVGIGTVLLMLPVSGAQRPLHFNEALFTATSALATTGLSIITPGQDLSFVGQMVLLLLMEIGGVGFMIGAVVLFRLLGRHLTLEERLSLRDSMGLVATSTVIQLARTVLVTVLTIQAIGALVLCLLWTPRFGLLQAAYYAVWHTVSAFTNASFDLFSRAPDAPAGFPTDSASLLTISTLVILGSIGIPVIHDLLNWPRRRRLALHTRLTLVVVAVLLTVGTVGVFIGESKPGVLFSDLPWQNRLLFAYFHSATSRTAGFVLVPLETMHASSVLLLMLLMFIGGSPASTGGGISTSTVAVLVLAMWSYVRGQRQIVAAGRSISYETVQKALAILVIELVGVMLVSWLLLLTQDATLQEVVFEVISAAATCGFTLGLTPRLDLFGQILIIITMFCGRLGALTIVAALTSHGQPTQMTYPEEQVLIG